MQTFKSENYIKAGQSIHIFSAKGDQTAVHTHDFIEIVYVRNGKATETIDGICYSVQHGDIIFINYGSTHAFSNGLNFEYINICFSPETMGNSFITPENAFSMLSLTVFNEMRQDMNGGLLSFAGKDRLEAEQILNSMLWEARENKPFCNRMLESYLNILLTKMLRKTLPQLEHTQTDNAWSLLSEYIDQNFDTPLSLSHLASKFFYNPSYFSRVFKEKFQMPVTEYINRKRIEAACCLLSETQLSVQEISEKVGFSDKSHFYRMFSKFMGGTPAEYRENNTLKK